MTSVPTPAWQKLQAHIGDVGGMPVRRALPTAARRLIGAWCFLDHAGPARYEASGAARMRVAPHPHIGLQTFSWLIEGEILHRDSLGSVQRLRTGELNLMTAGHGIAHSEEALADTLHLAQLWIALPESARHGPARFQHFSALPRLSVGALDASLLVGELLGQRSPVPTETELLGVELRAHGAAAWSSLPLDERFEYGLLPLEGEALLELADGSPLALAPGELLYLAPGAQSLRVQLREGGRLLWLGGPPFPEPVLLWWNFVGRTPEEIHTAAETWNAAPPIREARFGRVEGYEGEALRAPAVPALRRPA